MSKYESYEDRRDLGILTGTVENGNARYARLDREKKEYSTRYQSSNTGEGSDDQWAVDFIKCCISCCSTDPNKKTRKDHLKTKSEQLPPDGSIKAVAGIDDPATWAARFDLSTSQLILNKIDEQEARVYVAPSRILQRLHYLYNLESQDQLFAESAQYWQDVQTAYTEKSSCCSASDKTSEMAKFLHLSKNMADFYNRKEGDTVEQSVYAYTPERQEKINKWYKETQKDGSIPCEMSCDICVDSVCIPCCGGETRDDISCCEPPYAAHPQADWCCITHIIGAIWSDHPNAGCCFFQC